MQPRVERLRPIPRHRVGRDLGLLHGQLRKKESVHAQLLRHHLELQLLLLTHLTSMASAAVACFALVGASARTEQVTVRGTLEAP